MKNIVVSDKYQLIAKDVKSILIGAALMSAGTGSIYALEALAKLDLGQWTPIMAIICTMAINAVRKWLSESKYQK